MPFPAPHQPVVYEVDSTGDQIDASVGSGGCKTGADTCRLRAALEESNASSSVDDTIDFSSGFDGGLTDTITITGSALPPITDRVTIDGDGAGQCMTASGRLGPCVGIIGLAGDNQEAGISVDADNVQIEGLAVTDAYTGIYVAQEATSFAASDNWIGVRLDGDDGGNGVGMWIGPEADDATIGGTAAGQRNVIAYNDEAGLEVVGADGTDVIGNYFGVRPNGVAQAANGSSVTILDASGGAHEATDTVIGATPSGLALLSDGCDGGCNLFGGSQTGITFTAGPLQGATGPTTVKGNQFGLGADGITSVAPPDMTAVYGVDAADLTVGGLEAGDGNVFSGGDYGVYAALEIPRLAILGNGFGRTPDGEEIPPVGGRAVAVSSALLGDPLDRATIAENSIRMAGGLGIEAFGPGAWIKGNEILGAVNGIETYGDTETLGLGNLIEDNLIEDSGKEGIRVSNDLNRVIGNSVSGSGKAGIRVQNGGEHLDTSGNQIGGDTAGEENVISGSTGAGIEVVGYEGSQNEVARNRGGMNSGRFIRLVSADPSTDPLGPSAGIQPPPIALAGRTQAAGNALPGARIRLFRKASTEAGELASFLGEAVADPGGEWSIPYSALPGSTTIAATQTNPFGGTSELSMVTTDPEPEPTTPCSCPQAIQVSDETAPRAKITKVLLIPRAKVQVTFTANEVGSTFRCKLDKDKFKYCRSPKRYQKLKPGKHVFKVRAVDKAGNVGKPAKRNFTVLK